MSSSCCFTYLVTLSYGVLAADALWCCYRVRLCTDGWVWLYLSYFFVTVYAIAKLFRHDSCYFCQIPFIGGRSERQKYRLCERLTAGGKKLAEANEKQEKKKGLFSSKGKKGKKGKEKEPELEEPIERERSVEEIRQRPSGCSFEFACAEERPPTPPREKFGCEDECMPIKIEELVCADECQKFAKTKKEKIKIDEEFACADDCRPQKSKKDKIKIKEIKTSKSREEIVKCADDCKAPPDCIKLVSRSGYPPCVPAPYMYSLYYEFEEEAPTFWGMVEDASYYLNCLYALPGLVTQFLMDNEVPRKLALVPIFLPVFPLMVYLIDNVRDNSMLDSLIVGNVVFLSAFATHYQSEVGVITATIFGLTHFILRTHRMEGTVKELLYNGGIAVYCILALLTVDVPVY